MAGAARPNPTHRNASAGLWPTLPRDVLERARTGDPEALGAFFDLYFDRVFATVRRLIGRSDHVEDLTQDVFLKIQRGIARLDTSRDPAPWVYTVAANTCRDYWRSGSHRMKQRSLPLDHPAASGLLSHATNPEHTLLQAADEQRLQRAIERLPAPLRMTVVLHDCEGLGHQEIAEITGVNHAAIRKRHSRALQALATILREDETP